MFRLRVHELARELNVSPGELLLFFKDAGVFMKSTSAVVEDNLADLARAGIKRSDGSRPRRPPLSSRSGVRAPRLLPPGSRSRRSPLDGLALVLRNRFPGRIISDREAQTLAVQWADTWMVQEELERWWQVGVEPHEAHLVKSASEASFRPSDLARIVRGRQVLYWLRKGHSPAELARELPSD
ncbi:translation initiation factor IF-2 N-terminal domain-containing protein [Glycomyces sp. MUSA5-2]|uniref:translation initiation factor IF-2 N-terminal domain-containing protein n=1 Tax=Glycomyces sp. MUSA5-2 TaxID=2053002 RepID=UPI003FA5CD61